MDRAGLLAVVAAAQALDDAGRPPIDPGRIGAVVANVHGGTETIHRSYAEFFQRGADRVSPFAIPLGLTNSPVAAVARLNGLRGPSSTVATACAAGTDAIGLACSLIRSGRADAMLAGGAEAAVSPFIVAAYRQLGALSASERPPEEASRPFDLARDGFVIGEGAGVLYLEERDRAIARGARILAEVVGYASNCDAGHLTQPDPTGEGPAVAIRLAIDGGAGRRCKHRLRERPCDLHAARRSRGGPRDHRRRARARRRVFDQGAPRAHARRCGRARGDRGADAARAQPAPPELEPRQSGTRARTRLRACAAHRGGRRDHLELVRVRRATTRFSFSPARDFAGHGGRARPSQ